MTVEAPTRARLLLLLPTTTYRADAFVDAAKSLDLDLTVASETPSSFQERHPADLLTLDLEDADTAAATVREFSERHPVAAVVGVDDGTAVVAAVIANELGLPANPVQAVRVAASKTLQRKTLQRCGVPVPRFAVHSVTDDPKELASSTPYPCVLKPVSLSASRGVIRANDPDEFIAALERLIRILQSAGTTDLGFLVEQYVTGPEFALEGLVVNGALHVLALFDKPDPLEGPFFEETIYVTPSRVEVAARRRLAECAQQAVSALGLVRGPVHIEMRYNDNGPWLIEIAARPIGGKCGRVLRFGDSGDMSLETLILLEATGALTGVPRRESLAAGVMMVPIPQSGVLSEVKGVDRARTLPGVEDVVITAHRGQKLLAPPEGSQYLGFIFARGETPMFVEEALRDAHGRLEVQLG